jgi:hypothetical protein
VGRPVLTFRRSSLSPKPELTIARHTGMLLGLVAANSWPASTEINRDVERMHPTGVCTCVERIPNGRVRPGCICKALNKN